MVNIFQVMGIQLWNKENPEFEIRKNLIEQNIFLPFANINVVCINFYMKNKIWRRPQNFLAGLSSSSWNDYLGIFKEMGYKKGVIEFNFKKY